MNQPIKGIKEQIEAIKGEITQADIDEQCYGDHSNCPVARASARMFSLQNETVDVDGFCVSIYDESSNEIVRLGIGKELSSWIDNFDNENESYPINLGIQKVGFDKEGSWFPKQLVPTDTIGDTVYGYFLEKETPHGKI